MNVEADAKDMQNLGWVQPLRHHIKLARTLQPLSFSFNHMGF